MGEKEEEEKKFPSIDWGYQISEFGRNTLVLADYYSKRMAMYAGFVWILGAMLFFAYAGLGAWSVSWDEIVIGLRQTVLTGELPTEQIQEHLP